jgi:tetratricopeptide (TPR) repeat protein
MPDLPFTLTKDLVAALVEVTGAEPTRAEPVVVLAAYIDALAKEYGLSESLHLDVDPVERTQQVAPVMAIVNHYFAAEERGLDADAVRARLYDVFASLAADADARRVLNRSQPLTESRLWHLAQIYWNLEATSARPKLPIQPGGGRDIPVPGVNLDFALMTWTTRVNRKGNYKSSGQSFRTQGARLAVLVAQHISAHSLSAPESPITELDLTRTKNPEEPLEVTLKELAERAWKSGEYDNAVDLATSYLSIIRRKAEANPLDMEPDLAGAYLLKGYASLRPRAGWGQGGFDVGSQTLADLEKAVTSFTMLTELDPQHDQHSEELGSAYLALSAVYEAHGRFDESARAAQQAVSIVEKLAVTQAGNTAHQAHLRTALMALSNPLRAARRFEEAVAALDRAIAVAEALISAEPSKPAHKQALVPLLWGLSQNLGAAGRFDEAVQAAIRAVDTSERLAVTQPANQKLLASSLLGLSEALRHARRFDEAVRAAERSVSSHESMVSSEPASTEHQAGLAAMLFALCRTLREAARIEEVPATANRAVEIMRQLVATEPEKLEYRHALRNLLHDLSQALRALSRFDEAHAVDEELEGLGGE